MDQQCHKCGMYLWTEEAKAKHEAVCPRRDEPELRTETQQGNVTMPMLLVALASQIQALQKSTDSIATTLGVLTIQYGMADEVAKIVAEDDEECGEPIDGVGGPKSCN